MKYLKYLIFFVAFLSITAFKIQITNPNLRPFRLYIENFNAAEGKNVYSYVVSNLKLLPNFELSSSKDGVDFELSMGVEGDTFNAFVTNIKNGETYTFKLKHYNTDVVSNANLLSDKIYEKITQTKGFFTTNIVFSMNWKGIRQIFLTDITGKAFKKLTNNKGDSIAPKISHNRRYVVYTQYLTGAGTALRLIDLETLEDKLLYSSKEINLAGGFEKDDKSVLFVAFDGKVSKVYELFFTDNNKKNELYRTRARVVTPVTTFDNGKIAFVSDEYGSPQVFLLNKSDKKITKISQNPAYITSPSFTIHGTHYAYIGQSNGSRNIYITSLDGADFVVLTHGSKNYEDPIWLSNERFILTYTIKDNASKVILIDIPTQQNIQLFSVPAKINYMSAN